MSKTVSQPAPAPLTPPLFSCVPSLLLLLFVPSCFRTLLIKLFDIILTDILIHVIVI